MKSTDECIREISMQGNIKNVRIVKWILWKLVGVAGTATEHAVSSKHRSGCDDRRRLPPHNMCVLGLQPQSTRLLLKLPGTIAGRLGGRSRSRSAGVICEREGL
ncbi:hypothetical protein J6590_051311 [Homalodisca vitripennis]|nr:hypothetical protein J6590_051311 [Homalodisca vitripennis]